MGVRDLQILLLQAYLVGRAAGIRWAEELVLKRTKAEATMKTCQEDVGSSTCLRADIGKA
jgi:hypothetical protein